MSTEFLKEVLSIPSVFKEEKLVRDFIKEYAEKNGIDYYIDNKGNIYLTKGSDNMTSGEFYPCVVSHMDTVHTSHSHLVTKNKRLDIIENDGILTARLPNTEQQTGIGGDDKCGVYVCLQMFENFDILKGAFFVEEEIGMKGSSLADPEFFKNVGYAIQFDAPSDNWITETCSGVRLFDDEFKGLITETLKDNGYTNFSYDPFTDVNQLAQKFDFCCLNLGCGYYRQHTIGEYVVIKEVENSVKVGISLILELGIRFYKHNKQEEIPSFDRYDHSSSGDTVNLFDEDDDINLMSENITDSVIEMLSEGATKEEVKEFIYLYLEDNMYY